MNTYKGIPITEYRLLTLSVLFSVFLIGLLIVVSIWIYSTLSMRNKKETQHIKKLKENAKNDDFAKKQLEKIERKKKRKRKENKHNTIYDAILLSICICLAVVNLVWGVIPGWTDYITKDYVVYTGEINVYDQMRNSRIELGDGTTVWGNGSFEENDDYGTIVYSKRTKRFLGGID